MDDLIKRQEAFEALDKEYRCTDQSDDWDGLKTAMLIIENLPSAQPERTGRWIEQDDSWDGVYYECSACGEPWTLIDGTPWDNRMKFCPNCGAEMEGQYE